MSDRDASFFPAADMFTRAWSDFASKMLGVGMAFAPDSTPPDAAPPDALGHVQGLERVL